MGGGLDSMRWKIRAWVVAVVVLWGCQGELSVASGVTCPPNQTIHLGLKHWLRFEDDTMLNRDTVTGNAFGSLTFDPSPSNADGMVISNSSPTILNSSLFFQEDKGVRSFDIQNGVDYDFNTDWTVCFFMHFTDVTDGYGGWNDNYLVRTFWDRTTFYDFTPHNNLASWRNYAAEIGATTTVTNMNTQGVYAPGDNNGNIQLTLPNFKGRLTVNWGTKYDFSAHRVKLYIDNVLKQTAMPLELKTYSQSFLGGEVLKIEESSGGVIYGNLQIIITEAATDIFDFIATNSVKGPYVRYYDSSDTVQYPEFDSTSNDWIHTCLLHDQSTKSGSLYGDGAPLIHDGVQVSWTWETFNHLSNFTFGLLQYDKIGVGKIDDLRIYDRVLTANEIQALAGQYNAVDDIGTELLPCGGGGGGGLPATPDHSCAINTDALAGRNVSTFKVRSAAGAASNASFAYFALKDAEGKTLH